MQAALQSAAGQRPLPIVLLVLRNRGADEAARSLIQVGPFVSVGYADGDIHDVVLELLLSCDIRVIGPEASVGFSEGYEFSGSTASLLAAAFPAAIANAMALLGGRFSAEDWESWGGAIRGDIGTARSMASAVAAGSPDDLRLARELLRRAHAMPPHEACELEADLHALLDADRRVRSREAPGDR